VTFSESMHPPFVPPLPHTVSNLSVHNYGRVRVLTFIWRVAVKAWFFHAHRLSPCAGRTFNTQQSPRGYRYRFLRTYPWQRSRSM